MKLMSHCIPFFSYFLFVLKFLQNFIVFQFPLRKVLFRTLWSTKYFKRSKYNIFWQLTKSSSACHFSSWLSVFHHAILATASLHFFHAIFSSPFPLFAKKDFFEILPIFHRRCNLMANLWPIIIYNWRNICNSDPTRDLYTCRQQCASKNICIMFIVFFHKLPLFYGIYEEKFKMLLTIECLSYLPIGKSCVM